MMYWSSSETILRPCVEDRLEFRGVRIGIFCSRLCIFEVVGRSKDGGRLRALAKKPEDFRLGRHWERAGLAGILVAKIRRGTCVQQADGCGG